MKVNPEILLEFLRGDGKTCHCGRPLEPVLDKTGKQIGVTHSLEYEDYHYGIVSDLEVKIVEPKTEFTA